MWPLKPILLRAHYTLTMDSTSPYLGGLVTLGPHELICWQPCMWRTSGHKWSSTNLAEGIGGFTPCGWFESFACERHVPRYTTEVRSLHDVPSLVMTQGDSNLDCVHLILWIMAWGSSFKRVVDYLPLLQNFSEADREEQIIRI